MAVTTATPSWAKSVPQVGELAPDIQLTLVGGEKVSVASLRGKVVMLNYWAT